MALVIENTTEKLTKLSRALKDKAGLNQATSFSVARLVREHFRAIGKKQTNKFSRPSTFWSRMINSVRPVFSNKSAVVETNRAIALRYFGGIVRPTGSKRFLTIPVNPNAYNRKAADFPGMFVFRYGGDGPKGRAYLAIQEKSGGVGPGKKDKLTLMYLLKSFTKHKADESVLPNKAQMDSAMREGVKLYLQTATK